METVAFFSLGGSEIVLILIVCLLLFGADRLPSIARTLGRTLDELRRSTDDLKRDILNPDPPAQNRLSPPEPLPAVPLLVPPAEPAEPSEPSKPPPSTPERPG